MNRFLHSTSLVAAAAGLSIVAGCTGMSGSTQRVAQAPVATTTTPMVPVTTESLQPTPAQSTASAVATADLSSSIEPAALNLLTPKERADASQAAYYALQFGRPGAPRTWSGASGSGQVTVGPYVMVNNIACRDFTHTVTVKGTKYARKGTACREANNWSVVSSSSAA